MAPTVTAAASVNPLSRLESVSPSPAKADLKNRENVGKGLIGRAISRCFNLAGITQKEAAAKVDRDVAQVARWIAGTERAQIDAIFSVEELRRPFVIALAELVGEGVEVETVVRVKRRA